jgi:hypothetical protein
LSQILQHALKTGNIKDLFQLRFFIRDLYVQLRNLQQTRGSNHDNLTVYRSIKPTSGEDLPDPGALISMDTSLSTSTSPELAEIFAEPTSIIFEIQTGVSTESDFVFGNLGLLHTETSSSAVLLDEQEVLFQLYTSFRVDQIRTENNRQRVALRLLAREELDQMSNEVEEGFRNERCGSETLLAPGEEWSRRDDITRAVEYYQKLFSILLSNAEEPVEAITERLREMCDDEEMRSKFQNEPCAFSSIHVYLFVIVHF